MGVQVPVSIELRDDPRLRLVWWLQHQLALCALAVCGHWLSLRINLDVPWVLWFVVFGIPIGFLSWRLPQAFAIQGRLLLHAGGCYFQRWDQDVDSAFRCQRLWSSPWLLGLTWHEPDGRSGVMWLTSGRTGRSAWRRLDRWWRVSPDGRDDGPGPHS